jgi:hypothetical protein
MAELIHAKNLSWRHLHLLEDPFFARADIESAVKTHKSPGMAPNRGITNFKSWLDRARIPLSDLNNAVLNSLKNGASYYVHHDTDKPTRPLVYWKPAEASENSYLGENGNWGIYDYVPEPLNNKLRILLKDIKTPKPMQIYSAPEEIITEAVPVSYISQNERHMFELDVESENDAPTPDEVDVTLVGFNKTQNTLPIEEKKNVVEEFDSQIFRAKKGDGFEVFAIPDRMDEVKQDLKDNKNLQQSVLKKSISPLRIVDNYTRADDVIVHVAKYIIPENHRLVIRHEFGIKEAKPANDMFVLVNDENDWMQTIHASKDRYQGYSEYDEDGWIKLVFENIPKAGKFTLYNYRKDSNGSPGTLISEQTEKEIVEEKQYALVETAEVVEIEIDKTIYTEATEFDDWLEKFAG